VQRALGVVDKCIRWLDDRAIQEVLDLYGHCSNLGDESAARLVPHVRVPSDVFAMEHRLATRVGPLTLQALLRAGADPNYACRGRPPLYDVLNSIPRHYPNHRVRMAAMLMAAGADPTGLSVMDEHVETLQSLCDLRALSAFCASAAHERASSPAAWFVMRDGDLAVAHRVRAFLAPPLSQ
jgi:hypothetical protein